VRNVDFTAALAKACNRPALLPAPAFLLRLVLGEMADALLLASTRVVPAQLQALGYKFLEPNLTRALAKFLSQPAGIT